MNISYASNKVKRLCESNHKAAKKFGAECADNISLRLQQLESAETLQDIWILGKRPRGPHLHWLQGSLAGHLSVDVSPKLRIFFKPEDSSAREFNRINSIVVTKIGDPH